MKNNRIPSFRSPAEWEALIASYYDGTTSTEEEQELRIYTLQQAQTTANAASDTDRGVFAYVNLARQNHRKRSHRKQLHRFVLSTVSAAILVSIVWMGLGYRDENICEFYVGGKRYTDFTEAQKRMEFTMEQVQTEPVSVEQVLGNMFNGVDL